MTKPKGGNDTNMTLVAHGAAAESAQEWCQHLGVGDRRGSGGPLLYGHGGKSLK